MFLEPLQHNSSFVTRCDVLLEHTIPSWEDWCHVRVQLVRHDVQILRSMQGLLCHNPGPRDTQENVRSCMTWCKLREPTFTWNMTIGGMITNRDSSDQATLFYLSMVQSRFSRALILLKNLVMKAPFGRTLILFPRGSTITDTLSNISIKPSSRVAISVHNSGEKALPQDKNFKFIIFSALLAWPLLAADCV